MIVMLLHCASTIAMFGLIWFVQIVHYPLFQAVGTDGFAEYVIRHQRRTSWLVLPLMATEAFTSIALIALTRDRPSHWMAILGVMLVALIWLSTLLVQVPCHRVLLLGFDARAARRLVRFNWLRTVAWTCRVPLAFSILIAEYA